MNDKRPVTTHLSGLGFSLPYRQLDSVLAVFPPFRQGRSFSPPATMGWQREGSLDPSGSDHGKKKHPEHDENFSRMGSVKIKWQDPIFR
jgi:hypothetical protein